MLLLKTLKGMLTPVAPVTAQIPAAIEFRLVAGLLVRTGPIARGVHVLERNPSAFQSSTQF